MLEEYSMESAKKEVNEQNISAKKNEPVSGDHGLKSDSGIHKSESFLGFGQEVSFEKAIVGKLQYSISSDQVERRKKMFGERGVDVDPFSFESAFDFNRLTREDWRKAKESATPALTLLAADTCHKMHEHIKFLEKNGNFSRSRSSLASEALLRSLPLVHGTSASALDDIIEAGRFVSNKQLYKESGVDAVAFIESKRGATTLMDRTLGLDQYVFADFGRPHMYHKQQEVTLVIDPSVIQQKGVFMTEKDIADCLLNENPVRAYMCNVATPEYFYDIAKMRIEDSVVENREVRRGGYYTYHTINNTVPGFASGVDADRDQFGQPNLSAWEVKLPAIPVDAIRRVIVRDKEKFDQLSAKYSGKFEIVYEPKLEPRINGSVTRNGNYDILQIPGEYEKQFEKFVKDDYEKRVEALKKMDEAEKETVCLVLVGVNMNESSIERRITEKTDPYLHPASVVTYAKFDDLIDDMKNTDPNAIPSFGDKSKHRKLLWFRDEITMNAINEACTICVFERSKSDKMIGRIVDMKEIIPSKLA